MRKGLTEVVFSSHRSGSMSGLEADTIGEAIHHIGNIHKYARPEDVPEKHFLLSQQMEWKIPATDTAMTK